ncbi:hypothetical protein D030_1292B, partial [Vibrio parahaemolyticus AQ3810]
TNTVQCQ